MRAPGTSTRLWRLSMVLLAGASGLMLCGPASVAMAQQASEPADSFQLEEIVVTAQRRSESLQSVPVTVSAVTADMLESRNMRSNEDLNVSVPNLNIQRASGPVTPFLRGIGNNSTNPGQEQNVAIYVDGIYYASMSADVASFNNVERIEVLKGPQGTLFGRNTTGGLIQIVTKDPSREFSGKAGIGYGNYNTLRGNLYVTGAVTDTIAADLAMNGQKQNDGWGNNVVTGKKVHYRNDFNVRSKWLWDPSEVTRVTLSADYSFTQDDVGSGRQILRDLPALPATFNNYAFNGNIYDVSGDASEPDKTKTGGISLNARHDFDAFSIVNIAAFRKLVRNSVLDLENTPAPRSRADGYDETTETFSNEFQVLSPVGAPVSWIAGVYYFWADARADPIQIWNIGLGPALYQRIDDSLKTNSYSAFAQATFPIFGDRTKLTTGVRYTRDNKSITGTINTALATIATADQSTHWGKATWRASLDHKLTDNVMAYASFSTGFKSGVYNATSPTQAPVNPEKIQAYEVGLKSDLLDRRLRLNGAGYFYQYDDIQVSKFTGLGISQQNAASAEIKGLEVEIDAYLLENLRLNGGASIQKSEFTEFPGAVSFVRGANGLGVQTTIDATGNSLPRAPDMTMNLGFEYTHDLAGGSELSFNGAFYHNDGFFWDADNRLKQPSYNLINASIAWTSPDGNTRVRLWGANLGNKEYYTYVSSGNGNPDAGSPGAPRTYGITLDYSF
ncbi:TonB-dependent receptor [Niveispirillum sp. KHB5.9]|uniref:TonB-dependent receptor n=1 Tax=Niveispirillum sp. KHB5.9 TaxID=3400269 RepID=UPI003A8B1244